MYMLYVGIWRQGKEGVSETTTYVDRARHGFGQARHVWAYLGGEIEEYQKPRCMWAAQDGSFRNHALSGRSKTEGSSKSAIYGRTDVGGLKQEFQNHAPRRRGKTRSSSKQAMYRFM